MNNLELLLTVILAVLGALSAAYLGWCDSGEPFNARKFSSSIMHAIVAGLLFFVGTYTANMPANVFVYVSAFLGGMGIDAGWNRFSGAIGWGRSSEQK
jgi:hypothetical protein